MDPSYIEEKDNCKALKKSNGDEKTRLREWCDYSDNQKLQLKENIYYDMKVIKLYTLDIKPFGIKGLFFLIALGSWTRGMWA